MRTFNINEPFWGAWKEYGWERMEWGVGIDKDDIDKLLDNEVIRIKTRGDKYIVVTKDVKNSPIREVRYGKKLYIVRRNLLTKV
jgi:hypothetical protein